MEYESFIRRCNDSSSDIEALEITADDDSSADSDSWHIDGNSLEDIIYL